MLKGQCQWQPHERNEAPRALSKSSLRGDISTALYRSSSGHSQPSPQSLGPLVDSKYKLYSSLADWPLRNDALMADMTSELRIGNDALMTDMTCFELDSELRPAV